MPETPAAEARQKRLAARSRAARQAGRRARAERRLRLVDLLTAGMSVAQLAAREGISVRRTRALIQDILARREADPAAGFVQLQIARLSDAMMVSHCAMMEGNLRAVDRVLKIVREFDRYHGFGAAAGATIAPERLGAPQIVPALPAPQSGEAAGKNIASD